MIGKSVLKWMVEQDRTVAYLARLADMDPDFLIKLIAGETGADIPDLAALERAMGLPDGDLQQVTQPATDERDQLDFLRCYTVKQVAARMGVSPDTVRSEMDSRALGYIVVGQRVRRIPHEALEERLSRWRGAVGGETGRP